MSLASRNAMSTHPAAVADWVRSRFSQPVFAAGFRGQFSGPVFGLAHRGHAQGAIRARDV